MPSLGVLRVLIREVLTAERAARIPEPELVMDGPEQVAAYTRAGREGGSLSPLYLFQSSQVSRVIRPGETVLDLACGPANQLAQVARLNPGVHFVGVDLSEHMLEQARALAAQQRLANVEFHRADICDLRAFPDASADAVMSTLSFHHLPDASHLDACFREAARVLKPGGGIYFADLGHLRSEASITHFANQYAARQPAVFTLDYLNSLRAAFSLEDFRRAASAFGGRARVLSTFLVPYMIVVRSEDRRAPDRALGERLRAMEQALEPTYRKDLRDLRQFFRLGGLDCPYLEPERGPAR
ncbi:MAG: hypothetical protein Fur0039_07740 [Rhodocyclaceae bacterium]